jgi:hypothetical protein
VLGWYQLLNMLADTDMGIGFKKENEPAFDWN